MDFFVLVPLLYLAAVSVPMAVTDARTHRLPNALVVPGLVLLAWALVGVGMRDPPSVLGPLAAACVAALVLGAGWALGGVGMGDVKLGLLLGGVAGACGATDARALFTAAGTAALLSFGAVTARAWAGEAAVARSRIPLGPAMLAGFWAGAAAVAVPT